ncbi:uncharacterized protein LOC131603676 isoform X2 [Vicia villosa]|uniref:uncharacterized protein LOC131603676 isoform X2 n=1 Tax=Vicia villosa TaxID=3911 RepID=UPI00273B6766|nr:uncharacterized protein LOC131603676 isoform X2 [Vicia villosa]
MGSEGFGRPTDDNSFQNDVANMKNSAEFSSCNEFLKTQPCKSSNQLPQIKCEDLVKNKFSGNGKNCTIITSTMEGVPLQRKSSKSNRSNSSGSKRPRMSQSEDYTSLNGTEESKDSFDKLGSHNLKCTSPEGSPLPKQKGNYSKRGDKKNFKVPSSKAKFESSSMKMGTSIFSSSNGGNNFFGLYGLKHDFHDVTNLMDEPPLDELLKGTFDCPIISKDKGKKASNNNESFLSSVRKACSIIQSPKPVQSQNMEMDYSPNKKMSTSQVSSICAVESDVNEDKEQSCSTDMSSSQKDPCSETDCKASPLDFPLCQPKDVLEQIALHPFRESESLLIDVSKLAISTKNSNDLRSGKQVSRRPSLPSFPWSHAFGGNFRANSDTAKLSTSRSTCRGKWARIGLIATSTDIDRSSFTDLDSFSYDQSLVPSSGNSDSKLIQSFFANLPFRRLDSSSSVSCSKDFQVNTESGGQVDTKENDDRCPAVLVAAQTLCEIKTRSIRQSSDGILRWQRKPSHKAMKTCYLKSNEKHEDGPSTPVSLVGSNMVARKVEHITTSKKPRLSTVDNKNSGPSNNVKKGGGCPWPTSNSKSGRSSLPSKLVRNSVVENKRTNTNANASTVKQQHCMMMPPPARDLDKAYDSQHHQGGKFVLMDWKRGRDKSD